jgi:hypothetical protein
LAVSHGKDEEVGELVVGVGDGIQGRGDPVFLAEVSPHPEEFVLGFASFGSDGGAGNFERSIEFSSEDSSVLR